MNHKKFLPGCGLLRVIAMGMIISEHVFSGTLGTTQFPESNRWLFLAAIGVSRYGVDLFAVISGYLLYEREQRSASFFMLLSTIITYLLAIPLCLSHFSGEVNYLSIHNILNIMKYEYWYVTAYIGMFFFIPFLNLVVRHADGKSLSQFFLAVLVFAVLIPCFTRKDVFGFGMGNNAIFLMIMYCVGAALKKYTSENSVPKWLGAWIGKRSLIAFAAVAVMLAIMINGVEFITWKYTEAARGLYPLCNNNSPFIIAGAIFLTLGLIRISNVPAWLLKTVKFIAPLTLGIYLIHNHPLFRKIFILRLSGIATLTWYEALSACVCLLIILYGVCVFIDYLRERLFQLLQLKKIYTFLLEWLNLTFRRSAI